MSPRYTVIAKAMIVLILVAGCGGNDPTATPLPPTRTPISPSPTMTMTATAALPANTPPATSTSVPPTPEPEPSAAPISLVDSGQRLGSARSWDVSLGDLDDDGDLDAFVANGSQGDVASAVWLNDGHGFFTLSEQTLGYGMGIELGDLDGDGDLDAFVTDWEKASEVWLNDGGVQRGAPSVFADSGQRLGNGGGFDVALGDIDGDGDLDAFVAQEQANTVWLNNGDGTFTDTGQALGVAITAAVVLGDLDDDGDLDALAGGWNEPAKAWLNDGAGTFADSGHDLSPASIHIHGLALGDVDGDGDLDAFMAVASGDPNEVWLNDGSGFFSDSGQRLRASLGHGVSLGDLDGDGDLDAFVAHGDPWRGSSDRVWLNDGMGTFTDSGLRLGELASYAVGLGDLDNDGELDAFVAHSDWEDTREGMPNQVWLNETLHPPSPTMTMTATAAPSTDTLKPSTLSVEAPQGDPAILDGILSSGEWDNAAVEAFADGSELFLMHAGGYLYLGIRANTPGMIAGNVFIQRGDVREPQSNDEVAILHSSAALGTASYQKSEDSWEQVQDFIWQCRSTSLSDSAQAERDAFLQQEGWVAANSRMGTPEELEYRIEMPEDTLRLAVNFIRASNTSEKIPWPADLNDDCIKPTPGGLPLEMRFLPESWGTITIIH